MGCKTFNELVSFREIEISVSKWEERNRLMSKMRDVSKTVNERLSKWICKRVTEWTLSEWVSRKLVVE